MAQTFWHEAAWIKVDGQHILHARCELTRGGSTTRIYDPKSRLSLTVPNDHPLVDPWPKN